MPRPALPRFSPREIDPAGADRALALARDAGIALDDSGVADLVARVGAAAPAVLPALISHPSLADELARERDARGAIAPAALPSARAAPGESAEHTKARLRRMRHEAFARTALRELYADADVDRTAREWSQVASASIAHALAAAEALTEARNGPPLDERGARVPCTVLGMGKLGGEELNLGSDIDICYFYGTDDGAAGERTLNEHFCRVGALTAELLGDATGDGVAFRVDLRLRPEGSRGALANSLAGAERYYETWGRPWERAALLRARPVAGSARFGEALLDALRPFVFRRAVDPRIAADLAGMLERSRRELLQDDARDLKLGRGGIREAEFFVQALQLVWGGRHRSLQVAGTLAAVARLRALGLLSHREAQGFGDAWALLRRVEHRVQVTTTYETHLVPTDPSTLAAVSRSLGYASSAEFITALDAARDTIRALFTTLAPASTPSGPAPEERLAELVAAGADDARVADIARTALGVRDGEHAALELRRLARRADFPLGAVAADRYPGLGRRLLAEVRDAPDPDRALGYLADLFGRLGSAERYARRLADTPALARGLVGLFGASETLSKTLLARPDLLDATVNGGAGAPEVPQLLARIAAAVEAPAADEDDPLDASIGALRAVQREAVLAIGLADMAGALTPGEVARRLSALAEGALGACFGLAARETAERFGLRPDARNPLDGVAVFALGSLAARELGYGGDIDLIVLFDRDVETRGGTRPGVTMAEYAARLTQRAMGFLSMPHAAGPGYEVDARLRPSGAQGTLVVSREAFERYHARTPGRPGAASWERQALLRARFAAGDAEFGAQCAALIERIVYEQGPPDVAEVLRLRTRMERELGDETRARISLKYGIGALVDVEFAAQVLQMSRGADARVRTPTTRRALAALRDTGVLHPDHAEALLAGEKLLRRALLATRLVTGASELTVGAAATTTVARKLGYRAGAERSAPEALLAELTAARPRVREAFLAALELASK